MVIKIQESPFLNQLLISHILPSDIREEITRGLDGAFCCVDTPET